MTERWRFPVTVSLVAVTYLGVTACDWGKKSPEPPTTSQTENSCDAEPCPPVEIPQPPPEPLPSEGQPDP